MHTTGAGKTSLLNALGGRAVYGKVSGVVTLGGRPMTSQDLNYVPQFDEHNERFTPRELLTYMKLLQVSQTSTPRIQTQHHTRHGAIDLPSFLSLSNSVRLWSECRREPLRMAKVD